MQMDILITNIVALLHVFAKSVSEKLQPILSPATVRKSDDIGSKQQQRTRIVMPRRSSHVIHQLVSRLLGQFR